MLEPLSSAYYLARVTVEPHDADHAALSAGEHRSAAAAVYASGTGVERVDQPLLVKLGHQHLPVFGDEGVPTGTLAVPPEVMRATDIANPPAESSILVARADRAARLLEWYTAYEATAPAYG